MILKTKAIQINTLEFNRKQFSLTIFLPPTLNNRFHSVVMFADISGFTNLTETLSRRGPEGAEM